MKTITFGRLLAVGLMVVSVEAAPILLNGSLTGPIQFGGVPEGWTVVAGSPDTNDVNSSVGAPGVVDFAVAPMGPSLDGGTWVSMGRTTTYVEAFGQMVSGFTVGGQYSISWYVGNFGYDGLAYGPAWNADNGIEVLVDGVSAGSGAIIPVSNQWIAQSLEFTATAESMSLVFRPLTTERAYISIDGIALEVANPEPTTWVLIMTGLCGVAIINRRRVARRQD